MDTSDDHGPEAQAPADQAAPQAVVREAVVRESGVRESGVRARTDTDALVDVQRLELNRVNEELRQRARACVIEVERRHAAYFAHNPAPLIEITRAPLMAMAEALSANGDPQVAARRAMSALAVSAANEAALDALGVASIDALDLGDAPCLTFSSDELIEAVWALKAGRAVAVNAHMALRDAEARQVRLRVRPSGACRMRPLRPRWCACWSLWANRARPALIRRRPAALAWTTRAWRCAFWQVRSLAPACPPILNSTPIA